MQATDFPKYSKFKIPTKIFEETVLMPKLEKTTSDMTK
jgi:hypothetical protein